MDTEPVQLTFLRLEKAIQRTPYHPRGWVERADLQLNTFSAKFLPLAAEDVFKTIILCETHINTNDRPSWWMGYEMGFMMRTEDDDRRYNRFWLTWAKLTPYRGQASIILINALLRMDQFHDAESVCFMVMDWNSNELAEDIRRFILEAQDGIKSGKEGNTKVGPYLDYPWVDSKYLARSDELVQSINQEFARNEATRRLGFQACQLRDIVGEEGEQNRDRVLVVFAREDIKKGQLVVLDDTHLAVTQLIPTLRSMHTFDDERIPLSLFWLIELCQTK